MPLALFDLDNTLIAGDSDHAWGQFLVNKQLVDAERFEKTNDAFYEDYKRSELDITAYLRFALQPLTQFSQQQLIDLHAEFMHTVIEPIILSKGEQLIAEHKDKGDLPLIITATNRFITKPIATRLGVDHLLASDAQIINGRYTGEPSGIACYQEGKVKRLQTWMNENGYSLEGSYFYSDSANDIPLLSFVDHPIAVDPCPRLRQHAQQQAMPIISLR